MKQSDRTTFGYGPMLRIRRPLSRADFVKVIEDLEKAFPRYFIEPKCNKDGGVQFRTSPMANEAVFKSLNFALSNWPWTAESQLEHWRTNDCTLIDAGDHRLYLEAQYPELWTHKDIETLIAVLAKHNIGAKQRGWGSTIKKGMKRFTAMQNAVVKPEPVYSYTLLISLISVLQIGHRFVCRFFVQAMQRHLCPQSSTTQIFLLSRHTLHCSFWLSVRTSSCRRMFEARAPRGAFGFLRMASQPAIPRPCIMP